MSAKEFDPQLQKMDDELAGWSEPATRLRQALDKDELALYCQPIAALTGAVRFPMAEVLIRLREEEKAMLPPGEFLPVFEHYGLMPDLDRWVVRKVVQHLARGSRIPRFTINVSSQTLDDPAFPKAVALELVSAGVPGTAVHFEISEADTIARLEASIAVFDGDPRRRLRPDGVRLRPPHGDLPAVETLRPDYVKVDGAIIRKLLDGARRPRPSSRPSCASGRSWASRSSPKWSKTRTSCCG